LILLSFDLCDKIFTTKNIILTMRFVVVIAVLCLLQIALAVAEPKDPNKGATVLQPSGAGNASKGTTVLTPSGAAPVGDCVTGSKGCAKKSDPSDPNAPIAPPPPGMNVAIVIRQKADCGCEKDEVDCKCEKLKYVEPEIREPPKNCTCTEEEEVCACLRTLHHHKKRVHEHVAPEQAPNHVVPEVRDKLHHIRDCADGNPCQPQPEFVQPEIKKECACAHLENVDCPCNFLKPNF